MYPQLSEHPIKRGARRAAREVLVIWLLVAVTFFLWMNAGNRDWLLCSVAGGISVLPLWLLYRFVRFGIGR